MFLKVHESQLASLEVGFEQGFRQRLIQYLQGYRDFLNPEATESDIAAAADVAIERCAAIGTSVKSDIETYAARALEYGLDWEAQDRFAIAHTVLSDQSIHPEERFSIMQQHEMTARANEAEEMA